MTVYKVLRCPECGNTDLDGGPCEEPECENYGYFVQWCPKCYWDECNGPSGFPTKEETIKEVFDYD